MLEHKLCSLPAELLLFRGGGEKFKIKAKLSPAKARAELGNIRFAQGGSLLRLSAQATVSYGYVTTHPRSNFFYGDWRG